VKSVYTWPRTSGPNFVLNEQKHLRFHLLNISHPFSTLLFSNFVLSSFSILFSSYTLVAEPLFFYRGHFYIDDLAICPFQGDGALALAKQTGFYPTSVKAKASKNMAGPGVVTASSMVEDDTSIGTTSSGAVMNAPNKNRANAGANGSNNITIREFILGAVFGAALATAVLTLAKKKV